MRGAPGCETRRVEPGALFDDRLRRLLAALEAPNETTRVVGGAVRNLLLGLGVADVDLATTLLPHDVMRRVAAAGMKPVPTGIDHGTVTAVVQGRPYEVTTLRADIETDGRRAKVVFGREFAADAMRRDFTLNALSMSDDGTVYDYTGGLADLETRRIRFIGDARQRIREDYLRTLRFFRFNAAYGEGPLDAEGFDAAVRERDGLARLARERVRVELLKLLAAPRGPAAVEAMSGAGLLGPLLGGIATPARLARLASIEAAAGRSPDALLRMAAVGVLVAEDAERLGDVLRLSRAQMSRLAGAARVVEALHGLRLAPDGDALARLLFVHGHVAAQDGVALAHAQGDADADDSRWIAAWRWLETAPRPQLPIGGTEILARGVPRGSAVGAVLKRLQAGWIRAGFPRDVQVLARLLDESIAAVAGEGHKG